MITIAAKNFLLGVLFLSTVLISEDALSQASAKKKVDPKDEQPQGAKEVQTREVPPVSRVCATLIYVRNRVWVHRSIKKNDAEQWVAFKPKRGERVGCKDRVETASKSRAILKGPDYKIVMAPNTRIDVNRLRSKKNKKKKRSLIDLTYGKLRSYVEETKENQENKKAKDPSTSSFRIKTKVAVVGVRGTDFYTGFSPGTGKAEQAAIKGEILVERSKDKKVVSVKSGEQVVIKDSPKPPPKALQKDEPQPAATPLPELKIEKIQEAVVQRIQSTSSVVNSSKEVAAVTKEFQSKKAVEVLGKVESWEAPKESLPDDLENMQNEF